MSRSPEVTHRIMAAIPNRNTRVEITLRKALHRRGLRYVLHPSIYGRPDFAFMTARVAVFVDGDYWHGNTWRLRGAKSFVEYYKKGPNGPFWVDKIMRNCTRDQAVTDHLSTEGWLVIREWESDIQAHLTECADRVEGAVRARRGISRHDAS